MAVKILLKSYCLTQQSFAKQYINIQRSKYSKYNSLDMPCYKFTPIYIDTYISLKYFALFALLQGYIHSTHS